MRLTQASCCMVTVVAAAVIGCSQTRESGQTARQDKTLYERLGGEGAVAAVSGDFVDRALANPTLNLTRRGTPNEWQATPENITLLKQRVTQFVVKATGGPDRYAGKDMKTVHKGMRITDAEFDLAAQDLKAALDKFNVPRAEQDELFAIVGTTRTDIVEVPARK
jgi:hemoglobin